MSCQINLMLLQSLYSSIKSVTIRVFNVYSYFIVYPKIYQLL